MEVEAEPVRVDGQAVVDAEVPSTTSCPHPNTTALSAME